MTTTERKTTKDEPVEGYFDYHSRQDGNAKPKMPGEVDVDGLKAQISALTSTVTKLQETNYALMASPAPVSGTNDLREPGEVNLSDLPDPISSPEEYTRTLSERITKHSKALMDYERKQTEAKTSESNRLDGLWDGFKDEYSEKGYADADKVGYATQLVVNRAKKRGVDVNKYAFQTTPKFYEDITKEYDKVFGSPVKDDEPAAAATASDDDVGMPYATPNRTGAMFGGMESGHKPAPAEQQKGDMFSDLREIQHKARIY